MLRLNHRDGTFLDIPNHYAHPPKVVWLLTCSRGKRSYIYAGKINSVLHYNEVLDSSLLVNSHLGTSWKPKCQPHQLPWKVTKEFTSTDGETVFRIEKYGGGRNSPTLINRKQLHLRFEQQCDYVEPPTQPCSDTTSPVSTDPSPTTPEGPSTSPQP